MKSGQEYHTTEILLNQQQIIIKYGIYSHLRKFEGGLSFSQGGGVS